MSAQWCKTVQASEPTRYYDTREAGLILTVRPARPGRPPTKTWSLDYHPRFGGRRRQIKLGRYPAMGLAAARAEATRLRAEIDAGADPAEDRRRWRKVETFGELVERYLEQRKIREQPTVGKKRRWLERFALPTWADRKVPTIRRADVWDLVHRVAEQTPAQANSFLSVLRGVFGLALERGTIDVDPTHRIGLPAPRGERDRVLDADEIRAVWRTLEDWQEESHVSRLIAAALRLILATAQRAQEVRHIARSQIDGECWTIPREITKTKRAAHFVPLVGVGAEVVADLDARTPAGVDFLLPSPTRRGRPIARFERVYPELRRLSGVEDWTAHDLRRTAASWLEGPCKVPHFHVGRILGHSVAGVTGVYARWDYWPEKLEALSAWSTQLEAIVSGKVHQVRSINWRRAGSRSTP